MYFIGWNIITSNLKYAELLMYSNQDRPGVHDTDDNSKDCLAPWYFLKLWEAKNKLSISTPLWSHASF